MANKFSAVVLFLIFLAFQEMMIMRGEARVCSTRSNLFRGPCFRRSNCEAVCEREGFSGGKCKYWKCKCLTECSGGGGRRRGPPSDEPPPEEGPPIEGEPGEGPPSEGEPGEGPPGEDIPPVLYETQS